MNRHPYWWIFLIIFGGSVFWSFTHFGDDSKGPRDSFARDFAVGAINKYFQSPLSQAKIRDYLPQGNGEGIYSIEYKVRSRSGVIDVKYDGGISNFEVIDIKDANGVVLQGRG